MEREIINSINISIHATLKINILNVTTKRQILEPPGLKTALIVKKLNGDICDIYF